MVMPPVKSSPAKLFNMKALIIAALIAWLIASVVIAGLFRGDVMVNAKNSDKRYLRSHADTTGSDQTDNSEERLSLLPLHVTGLETIVSAFIQKIQLWWWRLAQKSASDVFADLKLGTTKGILFKDPAFSKWVAFVLKRYKTPELAYGKMFQTLAGHYKDDAALAKVLLEGNDIESMRPLAKRLLMIMYVRWELDGNTRKDFVALLTDTKEHAKLSKKFEDLADHYVNEAALTKTLVEGTEIEGSPVADKMLDIQFTKWKLAGIPEDEVFALLKLGQNEGELFESPVFSKWVAFVETRYDTLELAHEKIFDTLAGHYKDEAALAEVLGVGTQIKSTRLLAEELLDIQFKRWELDEKAGNYVFALLELGEKEAKLFESPVFSKWVAFVEARHEDSKLAHEEMFDTLAGHYRDEDALAEVLLEGKKSDSLAPLAEKLLDIQFAKWDTTSEDKVFALLKLGEKEAKLFESPVFLKWVAFVEARYGDQEVAHKKMFDTLAGHYTHEADLAKVLGAGAQIESTRLLAEKLLDIQFTRWELAGKREDDVFAILRLGEKEGELFESPVFSKWIAYVETRYKTPKRAHKKMFETLAGHYKDDAALAKILLEGTKIENMRPLAGKLLSIQLKRWKRAGKPENNVFARLKRALEDVDLLKTFEVLSGHYEDDAALAKALLQETKIERTRPLAEKLIDVMLTRWKLDGKPENDVFALLKHNQEDAKLLKNFETLADYHENEAALVKDLVEAIETENSPLAENLLDIQFTKWVSTPEDQVFALLKLGEKETKLFESPVFLKWVAFVETRYEKVDPKLAHEMIYVTLMGHYKASMDKVLLAVPKGNKLEHLAKELEGMRKMVEEGIPMNEIFPSLMKSPPKANDVEAKSVPSG